MCFPPRLCDSPVMEMFLNTSVIFTSSGRLVYQNFVYLAIFVLKLFSWKQHFLLLKKKKKLDKIRKEKYCMTYTNSLEDYVSNFINLVLSKCHVKSTLLDSPPNTKRRGELKKYSWMHICLEYVWIKFCYTLLKDTYTFSYYFELNFKNEWNNIRYP